MARFESSKEGKRDSKEGYSKREPRRDGNRFEGNPRGRRPSSRGSNSYGRSRGSNDYSRNRREVEMTKVICSSCGNPCEVPFKPTSTKPVFCNDCFSKKDKNNSNNNFDKDFETINEKLNKIMKALKIE